MEVETRPWGRFVVLHADKDIWLKRLIIAPGQSLSLQSHEYRDEFWYTTDGGVIASTDSELKVYLVPGVAVCCARGTKHRLTNTSNREVVVVEWAVGRPLESDIIRFEDNYGRS